MTRLSIIAAFFLAAGIFSVPAFADGTGRGPVVNRPAPLTPQQPGRVWNTEPIRGQSTCSCDCGETRQSHTQHPQTSQHVGDTCANAWGCSFPPVSGRVWHQPVSGGPYVIVQNGHAPTQHRSVASSSTSHRQVSTQQRTHQTTTHHRRVAAPVRGQQTVSLDDSFFATANGGVGAGSIQEPVGGGGVFFAGGSSSGSSAGSRAFATQAAFGGFSRGISRTSGRRSGRRSGGRH